MNSSDNHQGMSFIMMCKPASFGFNAETATDNYFMGNNNKDPKEIQQAAIREFENYVKLLRSKGVNVAVYEDTADPLKPDATYCCNWNTYHDDGTVFLYPMRAASRRIERRKEVIESMEKQYGRKIKKIVDLSPEENKGYFLEGAGSMNFDHVNKIVYASISPRTNKTLVEKVAKTLGYKAVTFSSADEEGREIYHINVIMALGDKWAILCEESIPNLKEREMVRKTIESTGKEIVSVTLKQVLNYAANSYECVNNKGDKLLVMSEQGVNSLTSAQKKTLGKYCEIVPIQLPTIEYYGGGSARCMASDVRLPQKQPKPSL